MARSNPSPFDNLADKKRKFHDPFLLPSNETLPTDLESALDLCLYLYYLNPQYRRASMRVISHFVTDIDFIGDSGDEDERDELGRFLKQDLDIFGMMLELGEEWACYGNGFCRIHFPFDRYLIDNRGGSYVEYSLDMFGRNLKYIWQDMKYEVTDPRTMHLSKDKQKKVKLHFRDKPSTDRTRIMLRKIDPRQVVLQHAFISGRQQVIWKFEPEFINAIKAGVAYQVNETPISMLRAIANKEDFIFNEGTVYHFKAPTISGVSNYGWGLPEVIANYRSIHQLQVYRKIDEAVGLDYMLPFRLFSPNIDGQVTDATMHSLLGRWGSEIGKLIKERRSDPFAMHALPFPVTYQEFGAEGKNLTPKDLIEFQTNDMLDGMGYPAELFRGSLQIQQIPTALRLFENSFHFIHRHFDNFLKWTVQRVLDYLNHEQIEVDLQLPRMADDLEARHIYLQLAAGAEIPREIAYKPFGIEDPVEAAKRRIEEDIEIQKEQQKAQEDFEREMTLGSMNSVIGAEQEAAAQEQAAMQGGGGGGAMGGAPAGASGAMTPLDIEQQAMQQAQELIAADDDGNTQKVLSQIKSTNPNLHALVKEKMEELRREGESQGRAQLPQMLGGGQQQ